MSNDTIKLNIGAGDSTIPGFIPIDAKLGHDALHLEYADGTVDEVYASHVLEHIHFSKHIAAVKEWVRVLKPGGRIRIAVPDFDAILRGYMAGEMNSDMLNAWLHGTYDVPTDKHKVATLNYERMTLLLQRCAVDDIKPFSPEYPDCSTLPESINIQGTKRKYQIKANPKVCMVMSRPRVGFMDMSDRISEACRRLGWPYVSAEGTEWGRGLTQGVEAALSSDEKYDYICTLDYDSVFSPDDLKELLRLMQENPDVGALYPVQMHRHRSGPLGSMDAADYSGEISDVTSGHFGCTMIRREVFELLPQPWFMSLPNPVTGRWTKGGSTLDADIYFWTQMWDHGFRTCMANNVVIGHMELCVKWPTVKGEYWQTLRNYRDKGKPTQADFDGNFWKSVLDKSNKGVANAASGISQRNDGEGVLPERQGRENTNA